MEVFATREEVAARRAKLERAGYTEVTFDVSVPHIMLDVPSTQNITKPIVN